MKTKITTKILIGVSFISLSFMSCKKDFLDLSPTEAISKTDAFNSEAKLEATMTGVYDLISNENYYYNIIMNGDVKGEDIFPNSTGNYNRFIAGYQYIETVNSAELQDHWARAYQIIANCNQLIENAPNSPVDEDVKKQYIAEARAIRAFTHFQLVQEFGEKTYTVNPNAMGVPVMEKSIEPTDDFPARSSVKDVYTSITNDLTYAEANIAPYSGDVYRMNSNTVKALEAKVYLVMGDWAKASNFAKEASADYDLDSGADLLKGFRNPTPEWIWAMASTADDNAFYLEVSSFYDPYDQGYSSFRATSDFFNSFDDNDIRKNQFRIPDEPGSNPTSGDYQILGDGYLMSKFVFDGSGANDQVLIRASEMVLIEAEAEARIGGVLHELAAKNALLSIQQRANPAALISTNTGTVLIQEILMERRKELFGEGQRYYDILRTNQGLNRTSASHWSTLNLAPGNKKFALPIPQAEINANPKVLPNPL